MAGRTSAKMLKSLLIYYLSLVDSFTSTDCITNSFLRDIEGGTLSLFSVGFI